MPDDREPAIVQVGPDGVVSEDNVSAHYCLVAIGRLQVTSTPNSSDLAGSNSNNGKHFSLFILTPKLHLTLNTLMFQNLFHVILRKVNSPSWTKEWAEF